MKVLILIRLHHNEMFVCPLLNGCSKTTNSGSMIREIIFFLRELHMIWPKMFIPPPIFTNYTENVYLFTKGFLKAVIIHQIFIFCLQ